MTRPPLFVGVVLVIALAGCGDGGNTDDSAVDGAVVSADDGADDIEASARISSEVVLDIGRAIEAVEAQLGAGQRYFEVTANAQFTNVFVAVDDATAAVPYLFVDGELQPPAPNQEGATGQTFVAADIDFVAGEILSGVEADLPETQIDALSVYGDGVGAVYVLRATSSVGGQLDIVVAPSGQIVSVDPL